MDPEIQENEPVVDASSETVSLHEASNEEVKSALAEAQKAEAELENGDSEISQPISQPNDSNSTQKLDETKELPVVVAPVVAPSGVAPTGQVPQGQAAGRQPESGNQRELLIRNRKGELAQAKTQFSATRTQYVQAKAQLENGLRELYREDPYEGNIRQSKINQIDEVIRNIDAQERQAEHIVDSQTLFLAHIGDDPKVIDSAIEMLREEGVLEQFVQQFAQNPWTFTSPESLVEIGKRALLHREVKTVKDERLTLAKHVLHLNSELEKAKGRTQKTVAQIQKNLSSSPSVTARSSGGAPGKAPAALDDMAIASMDSGKVKAMLAKLQAEEGIQ